MTKARIDGLTYGEFVRRLVAQRVEQKTMWIESTVPEANCPLCGHQIDRASSPHKTMPEPGDISVCICCAAALVFGENLRLREMTESEFAGLDPSTRDELSLFQHGIRLFKQR